MTGHNPTIQAHTGGTTITCSCGDFTATLDVNFGKPSVRESHLTHAHRQHVKDAEQSEPIESTDEA